MLITDKTMEKLSKRVVEVVEGAGFEVNVWNGAEPDPVQRLSAVTRFIGSDAGSDGAAIETLLVRIDELKREIGEPLSLREAGITEKQIEENNDTLTSLASKDSGMLYSPCEGKGEKLAQLFRTM